MSITLYPPQNQILCYIGTLPIRYYGLILCIAIFTGVFISYFLFCKRYSKKIADDFFDAAPFIVIFSIIGARLFYVLGAAHFYLKYPKEIIMINHGGLSIYGAILFGIVSIFILSKRKKFDILKYCDVIAVSMPLAQAVGRFGNFFNQEAFGAPTQGFLRLYVDTKFRPEGFFFVKYYHPAFLYESLLNLGVFILLLALFLKEKNLKDGSIFYLYLIFYAIIRIFIENIRIDSILNIGDFPIATLISALILVISLFLFFKNK